MTNEQAMAETPREYGELYYSADAVSAILRYVAGQLEGPQRDAVLHLSSSIPSSMPWTGNSEDTQQSASFDKLSRSIQLRLCDDSLFRSGPVRLTCLLRRGPSHQRMDDREHAAGMVNQQLDSLR